MLPVSTLLSLLVIICSRRISAQLQPTTPGPNETYIAGLNCTIAWVPDFSGTWRHVTIDLMSGSNNNQSTVTNVITGLDGTDASLTPFSWPCPAVDPYSAIYFYQFTNGDDVSTRAWTTRFTIASPANKTEQPEHQEQPDGSSVPWGIGHIIGGSKLASASSSSMNSNSSNRSDAIPSDSATEGSTGTRNSKRPYKHKSDSSNSTDIEPNPDPEGGDDDDQEVRGERKSGKSHSSRVDEIEGEDDAPSEDQPSTRTRPSANVSGATSAAARASAVAHSGSEVYPSSPNGSDTNDNDESNDSDGTDDGSHARTGSGSGSRHDSYPDSDWSFNEGSQAQAQSQLSPHDRDSHGIGGTGDDDCQCGADTNGGVSGAKSQMDASLSGTMSSVAPSLIVALVVLYL